MINPQRRIIWLAGAVLAFGLGGTANALDVGVFGDMSLSHSNTESSEPSFRVGSLDLYAAQYIDDNTRALFELQFQTFSGGDIDVEIQRFWIMREFSDAINVGIGRFHTPLGYWNRHFHHGILLQDTVTRPFILSFEGGPNAIIPTHLIGVLAEGDVGNGIRYEAAVANSNTIDSADPNSRLAVPNRADLSPGKALFGRVHYGRFGAPFKPGVFAMKNDVLESSSAAEAMVGLGERLVRQNLYGIDMRYEIGRFDLLAEYYRIENEAAPALGGRKHDSDAWFAQFGYQLSEQFKATYRHESLDFDADDPYYSTDFNLIRKEPGTEKRHVFALRYDFSESNAIMLEVNARKPQFGGSQTTTLLSWAFVMY